MDVAGYFDGGEGCAAVEGVVAEPDDAAGDSHGCEGSATSERGQQVSLNTRWHADGGEGSAAREGATANFFYAVGKVDGCEGGAATEGSITEEGDTVGDVDAGEGGAAGEGILTDFGNAVGDDGALATRDELIRIRFDDGIAILAAVIDRVAR